MDQNIKRWIGASVCCFIIGSGQGIMAQKVIFPQEQQAGIASVSSDDQTFTLRNDLLTAKFVKQNGSLVFGGCDEMNLKAGTDLFKVVLGNGTAFTSTQMTLESVETEDLSADEAAFTGSLRIPGKGIKAIFKKDNLTVTWHAVLRNGSHYLRTTLEVSSSVDQAMQSITPMIYDVDTETAGTVPVVVGNTRGAVLASNKIFAGLETPMGVNSAQVENAGMESFTPKGWNSQSFKWEPGDELPQGIRDLDIKVDNNAVSADDVLGARGYVTFRKTGAQTLTFKYTSGSHRLDIVGVDVVDGQGNVKASDYHCGYTGGQTSNNVYTLNIPEAGAYVLRYFTAGTKRSDFNSNGTITFSDKIAVPVVVYDLVAGKDDSKTETSASQKKVSSMTTKATNTITTYDRTDWTVTADGYNSDNGTGGVEAIIDGNVNTYWHSHYDDNTNKAMPHWFMLDMKESKAVQALGIVTRQAEKTVNGHIKEYEIYTGDDKDNLTKQTSGTLTYSKDLVWIPLPTQVTARYVKVLIKSSQNGAVFACCAECYISPDNPYAEQELTSFDVDEGTTRVFTPQSWTEVAEDDIPWRVKEQDQAYPNIMQKCMDVQFAVNGGTFKTTFQYGSGSNRLNMVGVDLLDERNDVVASDYHAGYTGSQQENNEYTLWVPREGKYKLRMMVSKKSEPITASGLINFNYTKVDTLHMMAPTEVPIQGYWRRNTTLKQGKTWEVSSVVGLVAPGQQRRSFLAYSERERAVPWRALPVYISWYELNIDRNNAKGNSGVYDTTDPDNKKGDYTGNMTSDQCVDVMKQWKEKFYDVYHKAPYAFVWDDGWDAYGTWTFNSNFPDGFTPEDNLAKGMGAGIGAWLGPVGGYGGSGTYRRNYWNGRGGMQLSNQDYRDYFVSCCTSMIDKYDFRFFKFDGISAQGTSFGPDPGDTGIENAEAIIDIEKDVRKKLPNIFYNTTVGTWASPFWFHYSDAVWRQDADCSKISNTGTDREQWITYRDYQVYKIFTQGSPLCPINTLMTHGLILTNYGKAYTPRDMSYDGVVREMRCAFGCGSGMVELYTDYKLMNEIKDNSGKAGALWGDLAECMDWQERNADVLPDIHWVGGNPWDGSKVNIYGWAAWNGKKATLTLRNPDVKVRTLTTTLRKVFDIPDYIKTTIDLTSSFTDQVIGGDNGLRGIEVDKPINIDDEITFTMPASSVFVFEGKDNGNFDYPTTGIERATTSTSVTNASVYDLSGRRLTQAQKGMVNIISGKKVIK